MAVSDITIIAQRENVIDYLHPHVENSRAVFINLGYDKWNYFTEVFDNRTWLAICILPTVAAIFLILTSQISAYNQSGCISTNKSTLHKQCDWITTDKGTAHRQTDWITASKGFSYRRFYWMPSDKDSTHAHSDWSSKNFKYTQSNRIQVERNNRCSIFCHP